MDLTSDDVRDVLRLLDALPYDELRLETDRFTLTLRRSPDGGWTQDSQVRPRPNLVDGDPPDAAESPPAVANPSPTGASSPGSPGATGDQGEDGLLEVRAPLLGTFYRAPKPGAPPFVEVGGRVEEDTVIGLVETMKLFTSVYARVRGTVAEICLADAEFAHEGAVLARVAPERP